MRRLPVLAALLTLMLLVAPAAALASEADGAEALVLAVEEGEPLGPEPAERTAEENPARSLGGYEDRDLPYTWGAAWLLAFAGLVGVVLLAGLYQLLVRGPSQKRGS